MPLTTRLQNNAFGESYFPDINGELFTERSAQQQFQQYLEPAFWQEDTCHLVIGSDSGLLINYVQQQGVPAGSAYLFIEPEALQQSVTQQAASALAAASHIKLCGVDNWIAVAEPLGLETYILKKRVLIHHSLAARVPSKALYQPLLQQVSAALDSKAYAAKLCLVDREIIERVLENVSENHLPVTALAGKFRGQTALILGAGPSLNEHLSWIQANRKNVVLFAASRLCRYLTTNDIVPDIVVSIDHQPINYELSKELLKLPPKTVLLNANHVSPQLLSQWYGKHIFVGEAVPWHSPLNTGNLEDQCGPTVTNTALVAAGTLGFSRILLSGVDFCSPRGTNTHADSEDLAEQHRRSHQVITNSGKTANSNVQMIFAAQHLAEQVHRIKSCEIINLSALACHIEGVEYRPLAEITLAETHIDDGNRLIPILTPEERTGHNQRLLEELLKVRRELKTINRLCNDAISFTKKIYKRDKQGNYNLKARDKLNNIQQRLENDFKHLAVTIKKIGMKFFINTMTTRDIHHFNDKQLEQQGHKYYCAYRDSSSLLDTIVTRSIARVHSRLEEDQPQPDINQLLERWQRDGQSGRSTVWCHQHPKRFELLSPADRQKLTDLQCHFQTSLSPPELVGPVPDQYWYLYRSIETYFTTGNTTQLAKELGALEAVHTVISQFPGLVPLCQGYLALLAGNRSLAWQHLRQTIGQDHNESALQLIATLALEHNDTSSAELALMMLRKMAEKYTPQYANLLKINGKIVESANEYTTYLQQHPDDTGTWLELAALYREIGETTLASTVYEYVLQQDPQNPTALAFMNP